MSTPITQILDEAEVETVARAIYPKIAWAYKFGPVPFEGLNEHAVASLKEVAVLALSAIDVAGIRAKTTEECALVVDNGQETIRETPQGSQRILTPRTRHNLTGIAYATAIRALSMGIRADKWMPIETAPKDGNSVLLYWQADVPGQGKIDDIHSCFWDEHGWCRDCECEGIYNWEGGYTHWQPLPLPPALSKTTPT